MERFGINTNNDLQLERDTLREWQQGQKLAAPGTTSDLRRYSAVLCKLYGQRDRARKKTDHAQQPRPQAMSQQVSWKNKGKAPHHFEGSEASRTSQETQGESGYARYN